MSNFQSIQFDAQGNEVTPDPAAGNVLTKEQSEATPITGGAKVRDVAAENAAARKTAEQISGRTAANLAIATEAFEANLQELVETDQMISHLEGAGKPVPDSMRVRRSTLNVDVQINGAGLPEDLIEKITARVQRKTL